MRGDNEHRRGGLEAHAALDADDGVAHMDVAAEAVTIDRSLQSLDGGDGGVKGLAVHGDELALLEPELHGLVPGLGDRLQIGRFRESLGGIQQLAAADGGTPEAHVVGILELGEIGREAVVVEVVHLFLAGEGLVAGEGDDLHVGAHHLEGHVETDLVIAGTGGAVGDGIGTDFLRVTGDGDGLENALGGDGDGIGAASQDIAEDHVFEALLVVLVFHVQVHEALGAQFIGVLFVLLELGRGETTGVRRGGVHFVALVGEVHDCIGGVEASAVCDDYFHITRRFLISGNRGVRASRTSSDETSARTTRRMVSSPAIVPMTG